MEKKGKKVSKRLECKTSPASPLRAQTHTECDLKCQNTHTDTHAPYSPLPQPAPAPPPDPVIPRSLLRLITPCPPTCRSSAALHLFPPSAHLPAGRLSVDVKVGSLVSNSPSDTVPLTFRCTLSTEGISPPPRLCLFSSSVTAAVHSGGCGLAREVEVGVALCCHDAERQALTCMVSPADPPALRPTADRPAICCLKRL